MREIKFRAFSTETSKRYKPNTMFSWEEIVDTMMSELNINKSILGLSLWFEKEEQPFILMQYTGLKDKNKPCKEVYEGDIIDSHGKVIGNKYEMEQRETDLLIEGLGTSAWSKTEERGLERGLRYAE